MDPTTHRRVFKVSKSLDRLALMCEQHKLQVSHRRGLPDWTLPSVPAGVPTSEHERVPTFFAWERADPLPGFQLPPRQNEPEAVDALATPTRSVPGSTMWANTPDQALVTANEPSSPAPPSASAAPSIPGTPAFSLPAAIPSDQATTPARQSSIDLTTSVGFDETPATPAPGMVTPVRQTRRSPPPPPVSVPVYNSNTALMLSPGSPVPSPRYKHGRRLCEIDMARPSSADSFRSTPAGISTVAADRFKKRPSFRSPDWAQRRPNKRLAFLDSQVRLAEEEHKNSERVGAPSDRHWDNRVAQSTNERRKYVLSGSDALQVAHSAARDFLHEYPQENTVSNRQEAFEGVHVGPAIITSETPRKSRPASVDEAVQVDLEMPAKPTVRVTDRTTQTDQLEAQSAANVTPPVAERVAPGTATATPTRPLNVARRSASPQLMNPTLMNPRYPPEPSAFRAQTSYRLDFSDRRVGR